MSSNPLRYVRSVSRNSRTAWPYVCVRVCVLCVWVFLTLCVFYTPTPTPHTHTRTHPGHASLLELSQDGHGTLAIQRHTRVQIPSQSPGPQIRGIRLY